MGKGREPWPAPGWWKPLICPSFAAQEARCKQPKGGITVHHPGWSRTQAELLGDNEPCLSGKWMRIIPSYWESVLVGAGLLPLCNSESLKSQPRWLWANHHHCCWGSCQETQSTLTTVAQLQCKGVILWKTWVHCGRGAERHIQCLFMKNSSHLFVLQFVLWGNFFRSNFHKLVLFSAPQTTVIYYSQGGRVEFALFPFVVKKALCDEICSSFFTSFCPSLV